MANAFVLVPGTGGVTLRDSDGVDIGYPVGMKLSLATGRYAAEEYRELLSMEHRAGRLEPEKTTLKPGLSLQPDRALEVAYNQVPARFERFVYDWRADMRWNAANLLDYLVEARPDNGRWNIATHSQGGLLVALASKLYADSGGSFDDLAAAVVFGCVPFAGTINSARALLTGENMGESAAPVFKDIVRTWPALYQMLPRWEAVSGNSPEVPQLTDPDAWAPHGGVPSDMLDRARETQALLANPLSAIIGNTRLALYFAINRETSTAYTWDDGLAEDLTALARGDTLVPEAITTSHLGARYVPFTRLFDAPMREHAFVYCDPAFNTRMDNEWV